MSDEAELLYIEAQQYSVRRGLFKPANPQKAMELYEKAGNLFKMKKNYEKAGDSFLKAAQIQSQQKDQIVSFQNIRNAINCFNLINSPNAKDALELLISESQKQGNFVQAGKAIIQQAEQFEKANTDETNKAALDCYYKALDILEPEQNVDSDVRKVKESIAALEIKINKDYLKAKDLYEQIGIQCTSIRLLQFSARGYFLQAFLCVVCLEDEVATIDTYAKYQQLDPNIDDSPEGDFMKEICEAVDKGSKQEDFDQAYGKFMMRTNIRNNYELRNLIFNARDTFKVKEEPKQVTQELQVESNHIVDQDDEDLL